MAIIFKTNEVDQELNFLERQIAGTTPRALNKAADEVLRLSQKEVPHDTGMLQNSGAVEPIDENTVAVGYNKEYAAYQHEGRRADGSRPIMKYGKGRKGKYLEDPIKNNLATLQNIIGSTLQIGVGLE